MTEGPQWEEVAKGISTCGPGLVRQVRQVRTRGEACQGEAGGKLVDSAPDSPSGQRDSGQKTFGGSVACLTTVLTSSHPVSWPPEFSVFWS